MLSKDNSHCGEGEKTHGHVKQTMQQTKPIRQIFWHYLSYPMVVAYHARMSSDHGLSSVSRSRNGHTQTVSRRAITT